MWARTFVNCTAWIFCLPVGCLFLVAALSKLLNPAPTARVIQLTGVTEDLADVLIHIIMPVEFAVGFALVVAWKSVSLLSTALFMLGVFTTFLIALAMKSDSDSCACLGPLIDSWTGGSVPIAIMRNLVLMVLLAFPLWSTIREVRTRRLP